MSDPERDSRSFLERDVQVVSVFWAFWMVERGCKIESGREREKEKRGERATGKVQFESHEDFGKRKASGTSDAE